MPLDVMIAVEFARCRHFLKSKPLHKVIKIVLNNVEVLQQGEHVPGQKAVQRRLWAFIGTTMTVVFRHRKRPDTYKTLSGLDKIPKKRFPRKEWQLVYAVAEVNAGKLINIHQGRHRVDVATDEADISYDGVAVTNSCGRSFEVLSCRFINCRQARNLLKSVKCSLSDMPKVELWQIRPCLVFQFDRCTRCPLESRSADFQRPCLPMK